MLGGRNDLGTGGKSDRQNLGRMAVGGRENNPGELRQEQEEEEEEGKTIYSEDARREERYIQQGR